MDALPLLPLISRWVHIGSAVLVSGTLLFYALAYVPIAQKVLDEETRERLREPIMRRMKLWLHPPIILFLASGFYNYIAVTAPNHEGQGLYHALFGIKFLLAILVFALMLILTSTMKWSEKLRAKTSLWQVLIVALIAVIAIAGVMKVMPHAEGETTASEQIDEIAPTN